MSHFWPILKWASFFDWSWAAVEVSSSLTTITKFRQVKGCTNLWYTLYLFVNGVGWKWYGYLWQYLTSRERDDEMEKFFFMFCDELCKKFSFLFRSRISKFGFFDRRMLKRICSSHRALSTSQQRERDGQGELFRSTNDNIDNDFCRHWVRSESDVH